MLTGTEGWTSDFHTYMSDGVTPYPATHVNRASVNEVFEKAGNITQTITGLKPNGIYRFSIPAFFRAASNEICAAADDEGLVLGNAYVMCGDDIARMKTWAEDRTGNSYPNTMEEASECFSNGLYQNSVTGRADADGTLTIGLGIGEQRIPGQWLIWGGAKLEEVAEPIDYTDNIINPSFENGFEGWTNSGMQRQNNNEKKAAKTGTY